MRLFINRFFAIFFLYLAISFVITYFTPYHWGNPWFSTKIQHLEQHPNLEYNTFFFGSSRIYRQINPKILDEHINTHSSETIQSFNLGAPATFTPQTYYLLNKFMNSPQSKQTKYCFMELMEINFIGEQLLHQERTTYWQNLPDLLFIIKSISSNSKYSIPKKIKEISKYSISYLEKLLHLGHFGTQFNTPNYYDKNYLGSANNGFYSLDDEYTYRKREDIDSNFEERKSSIIENPKLLEKRKEKLLNAHKSSNQQFDKVHLNRILKMIESSKEKGIHLIFIITPKYGSAALINLSEHIPDDHLIDLSNPEQYEEFYLLENSFDVGHLNNKGSILFTKELSNQFLEIVE